jgi:hypothetical protein
MGGTGMSHIATSAVPLKFDVGAEDDVFRKITLRLIPFLFLCYLAAYLDRVNVGFAKLQMQKELGFSETVYALGAGIFFLGYVLFEVPSNIILYKVGARLWLARRCHVWTPLADQGLFLALHGSWVRSCLRPCARTIGSAGPDVVR